MKTLLREKRNEADLKEKLGGRRPKDDMAGLKTKNLADDKDSNARLGGSESRAAKN